MVMIYNLLRERDSGCFLGLLEILGLVFLLSIPLLFPLLGHLARAIPFTFR